MTFIKKLRKEINKIVKVKDHILYDQYHDFPLLKDCKSEWLKANFSDWLETEMFLPGIYNLSELIDKNISLEGFKEVIRQSEKNMNKKINFFPNEKYYFRDYTDWNSIWGNILIDFTPEKKIPKGKENEYVPISKLKEYEISHPCMKGWTGIFSEEVDKKTIKKLIKEKLVNKCKKYEKKYFLL